MLDILRTDSPEKFVKFDHNLSNNDFCTDVSKAEFLRILAYTESEVFRYYRCEHCKKSREVWKNKREVRKILFTQSHVKNLKIVVVVPDKISK